MEKVKWVTTPKCCDCKTPWGYKKRFCCMACERIHEVQGEKAKRRTEKDRKVLKAKAEMLRKQGFTIGEIAQKLKIPRATAQRAAAAVRKCG